MSTNADRLALAAQSAPPAEIIICHNSVLYWMKEAGLITQGKFDQLQQNTPAGGWDAVLANRSDTLVQHYPQGLANLPRGAVIGFIDPLMLQHSMVRCNEVRYPAVHFGTVPATKFLLAGTVPATNHY